MNAEQFLNRVRERTGLQSAAEALAAGRATLRTLAEQLTGEEAHYLSTLLPPELALYLEERGPDERAEYPPDTFFQRVSQREGVPLEQARLHARAVLGVMAENVPQLEDGEEDEAPAPQPALTTRPDKRRIH